jgi:hypothetical protein
MSPRILLSSEQRTRLFAPPADPRRDGSSLYALVRTTLR